MVAIVDYYNYAVSKSSSGVGGAIYAVPEPDLGSTGKKVFVAVHSPLNSILNLTRSSCTVLRVHISTPRIL